MNTDLILERTLDAQLDRFENYLQTLQRNGE